MKFLSNLIKSAKIILVGADLTKGFKLSVAALTIYYLGADSLYINAVVGIHSALFLQCVAFLMCLTLLLGLITRSFSDDHARSVLVQTKKTFFFLGFTMLNAIVAPIAFLIMGSIISSVPGDLKWGPIAFLIGIFPFVSIIIFLSATKDMFRGLKQEIRFNRPLSIL